MTTDSKQAPPARMALHSDHIAGVFFILFGIGIFALSSDLPFGTLSSPGAGMLPKLTAGLMMIFAAAIVGSGKASQPLAAVDWSDRWHASLVVLITAAATFVYQDLGFL